MTGVGCRFNPVSKDNACNGVLHETWLMLRLILRLMRIGFRLTHEGLYRGFRCDVE